MPKFYLLKNGILMGVFTSLNNAISSMFDDVEEEEFWAQRNNYYCARNWWPTDNPRHGAKLYLVDEEEEDEFAITYVIAKRKLKANGSWKLKRL